MSLDLDNIECRNCFILYNLLKTIRIELSNTKQLLASAVEIGVQHERITSHEHTMKVIDKALVTGATATQDAIVAWLLDQIKLGEFPTWRGVADAIAAGYWKIV